MNMAHIMNIKQLTGGVKVRNGNNILFNNVYWISTTIQPWVHTDGLLSKCCGI